jgi:GTP-binding protein
MEERGYKVFRISAATNSGLRELMFYVADLLDKVPEEPEEIDIDVEEAHFKLDEAMDTKGYEVNIEDGVYVITGPFVDRIFMKVNINDNESLKYFQKVLRRKGIIDELKQMGINDGDTVRMNDFEFDFIE